MHAAFFLLTILLVHLIPLSKSHCLSDIDGLDVLHTADALLDGSTNFSLNLLQKLAVQDQRNPVSAGIFFSPYSVWSALMVTYLGAKGQTEAELKKVLRVGGSDKRITLAGLNNLLNENSVVPTPRWTRSYELANSVFFPTGITVNKCIYGMIGQVMGFLDFYDPFQATKIINEWVERETNSKIQDLIPSGGINYLTKMVIANAVYFKDSWLIQFDPRKMSPGLFTLHDNTDIHVNMMYVKDRFRYGVSTELQCTGLDLPYSGELNMLILLPNHRTGVSALAKKLTQSTVENFYAQMDWTKVEVSLPKFKIEDNFELSNVLREMGIRALFNSSQANLWDLSSAELFVDSVYHKAAIDVDQEGIKAAAAETMSLNRKTLSPVSFIANHPFLFLIRDNRANVILFAGTVRKPLIFGQS